MDTWSARKRPWEAENPTNSHHDPRDSGGAAPQPSHSPLPQQAGYPPPQRSPLGQRRLPPLSISTCSTSTDVTVAGSRHHSSPGRETTEFDTSRQNLHSLADPSEPYKRARRDADFEYTQALGGTHATDRSLPPFDASRRGTDPRTHAGAASNCCPSSCEGQACSNTRHLMRRLASELVSLDSLLLQNRFHSIKQPSEFDHLDISRSLQWALDLVRRTNTGLRDQIDDTASRTSDQNTNLQETSSTMRRAHPNIDAEEQSPPSRHASTSSHSYTGILNPRSTLEDSRRHAAGTDTVNVASPHPTGSPSGSTFMRPHSPMQAPQSFRSSMLPSPASMNFPNIPSMHSRSSPTPSFQGSAQTSHLQDLQHQISVKTLAFQTLQREYDSLLHKLERQRTKCAALEKKFEVSDVEINSLLDEKEKLQSQVVTLESQVEELQQSRDEARTHLMTNGTQYMKILEMANRLQAQSSEDKKRWDTEKVDLEQRIKLLEEAMVTGAISDGAAGSAAGGSHSTVGTMSIGSPSSSTETINVLRAEIGRLRTRTQGLETALQTMKEESISIQAAAKQLVESSGRIEKASQIMMIDG